MLSFLDELFTIVVAKDLDVLSNTWMFKASILFITCPYLSCEQTTMHWYIYEISLSYPSKKSWHLVLCLHTYSKSEWLKRYYSNNGCLSISKFSRPYLGCLSTISSFVNSLSSAMEKRNKPYFYTAVSHHLHCQ